jgi:hypothetical protein
VQQRISQELARFNSCCNETVYWRNILPKTILNGKINPIFALTTFLGGIIRWMLRVLVGHGVNSGIGKDLDVHCNAIVRQKGIILMKRASGNTYLVKRCSQRGRYCSKSAPKLPKNRHRPPPPGYRKSNGSTTTSLPAEMIRK